MIEGKRGQWRGKEIGTEMRWGVGYWKRSEEEKDPGAVFKEGRRGRGKGQREEEDERTNSEKLDKGRNQGSGQIGEENSRVCAASGQGWGVFVFKQ